MKITYNWLKDFVDIRISAKDLAEKLTMAGLEVTSLEDHKGDSVFEIEVTSNRPDWLSVIGIAREIAAITGKKLKYGSRLSVLGSRISPHRTPNIAHRNLGITIENRKDCPLYTAKIIKDVKVAPSPDWLRNRLESIGCRSINNIVDLTNYVLFTWGEPLHAFDLDRLVNPLAGYPVIPLTMSVRRAKQGEEIITIDGIKRVLDENILVIAIGDDVKTGKPANRQTGKPIAIAGIMGGKDTEITGTTKNILLEAAVFNPITIRRGRQKLGIQTDSSYRFERGVALESVRIASDEGAKLIVGLAGGICVSEKFSGVARTKNKIVELDAFNVSRLLGTEINDRHIKRILTKLGFKVTQKPGKRLFVESPFYRRDIKLDVDLIEEVARIFGYENIPKSLPPFYPYIASTRTKNVIAIMKDVLIGLGAHEVITYSLVDRTVLQGAGTVALNPVEVLNPLSKEQEVLRPTIVPSLLRCIAYNLNQKQESISIFEIANVFLPSDNKAPEEKPVLGIALCGTISLLLEQGCVKDTLGILHLKGIIEALFGRLGIKNYDFIITEKINEFSLSIGDKKIGMLLKLPDDCLIHFDIKNKSVVVAELYLSEIVSHADLKKEFTGLPNYPGISRDISLVVKEEIKVNDVMREIKDKAGGLLQEIKVTDYYRGKQIAPGFKGLTLSCLYRSHERTLSDTEVNPVHYVVCTALVEKFDAKIR